MAINNLVWVATPDRRFTAWPVMGCEPATVYQCEHSRRWSYKFNGLDVGYYDTQEEAMDACNAEHKKLIERWVPSLHTEGSVAGNALASQVIDLSHFDLSKIEAKKQPDKPGVWAVSQDADGIPDGVVLVSQKLIDDARPFYDAEYRFLCDFIPPRQLPVIPKKPENALRLMRLTRVLHFHDGSVGDMRWCVQSHTGHYLPFDDNENAMQVVWAKWQCEPVDASPVNC